MIFLPISKTSPRFHNIIFVISYFLFCRASNFAQQQKLLLCGSDIPLKQQEYFYLQSSSASEKYLYK